MKPTLSTQVRVFARMLGMDYDDIEWDHTHAKKLGGKDDRHDPDNWTPRTTANHKTKTFGPGGEKRITTYGSDIHAIAKVRRLEKQNAEFNTLMRAGLAAKQEKRASKWPNRGFQKRRVSA